MTDPASSPGTRSGALEVVDDEAVRILRFNRPEARNAFNAALYDAVTVALHAAQASPDVHVVVLTGSGGAFSAGQDLKEMAQIVTGEATFDAAKGFRGLLDAVGTFDKPLMAAVNGVAVGLGFTILPHCDLVLVAQGARLRVPFSELGVPPEAASSYLFPRTMGWQRAARLLFTSDWVSDEEAVELGVALRCVPAERLMEETMALARRIAAGPLDALRATKRLLLATRQTDIAATREREDAAFADLLGSAANRAALDRFGETGRLT